MSTSPGISVLITDLDNTLWDWVAIWHASYSALIRVLTEEGGIDREALLDEIHEVHRRHGTSEYALLLEELPSLAALDRRRDTLGLAQAAISAFQEARQKQLSLYPGVIDTLIAIRQSGTLVVAYTESMAFYTAQRIRKLGLDGTLQILYSSPDHDFPQHLPPQHLRRHPDEHYELDHTEHRFVERGVVKPNPEVLMQIIHEVGATPATTAYVGDSLMKDITMAQTAGVVDMWAAYGAAQERPEYDLLRRVTHWRDEDVERERRMMRNTTTKPTYTLTKRFSELLDLGDFTRHEGVPK